ncbi:MAG TPA: hypothetical protein VHX61_12040 [Rhizomicrobium sp.]|jgi:hypothetical protein|nr:hypothetical protein [Rhizomicrobium sp.]
MSDAVEIAFRADLAELESGTADAVALLNGAAGQMADAFAGKGDTREADEAQRIADEKIRIEEQVSLKEIAIETDRNNFLYQMGEESLDQWKSQAAAEENARYAAELAWLDKKTAADQGNAAAEARDLEQGALLYQDHVLALQKIDEQYAQRKRALDQQELQEFISADNAKLQDGIRALDAEYKEHQITAQQRYQLEQQLTEQIYAEELKRLDAELATLTQGTKAYQQAMNERQKLEQQFTKQSEANTNQLATEEAAKWTQLGNSIKSSFNSALDGMIFEGHSFEQFMLQVTEGVLKAFLTMGEQIAENWIETQIAAMFETKTTQGTTALGQVQDAAAVAGANAYSAYAAYPPIAAAMAADAVATTEGFSGLIALATGAWDLKSDTVAQLHKGEMVVPENFASGLRGNGGGLGAGGDVHMNYSPTVNSREPATLSQMLSRESGEMLGWMKRQMRNGALRA